ncbi:DUF998 domain-containing protein [Tomitella cavernea]|uniref:DUF998 domain-containing protein n=1 Tax=Tomitella cavernea TaxID=1387982 RepID=UPI0019086FF8|nr:DUF998 domain-containing protein [Tomitella cavernea]
MLDSVQPRPAPGLRPPQNGPPLWAAWVTAFTPTVLIVGWIVAGALQPPEYDPIRETISVLSGLGAGHSWIMTAALYCVALSYLATAVGLHGVHRSARMIIAFGGVAGLGVAYFPQPANGSTFDHMLFAVAGAGLLTLWPFVMAYWRPSLPLRGSDASDWSLRQRLVSRGGLIVAGLVIALSVLALYVAAQMGMYLGLAERICTGLQALLPFLVAIGLRRSAMLGDSGSASTRAL